MMSSYKFNRLEFAGSLGDLGTLLPLAIGLILINGLSPTGLFISVGLFYILSGSYYGVPIPVQPMKVIGAYSIATAMTGSQITASGLLIGIILLVIGTTGAITFIGRYIPKSVVRGVQLSTGTLLMVQGIKFMLGTSKLQMLQQSAEPFLMLDSIGPLPIGIIIGTAAGLLTLLLLDSKKIPAGLVVVSGGLVLGLLFGNHETLDKVKPGIYLPQILPFGWPTRADFTFALFALVLPQIPMTLGNAVIAYADLSKDYFGKYSGKVTYPAACITMGLANLFSSCIGGMPLCHGAGGLAAHYRFGARTGGSNLIIGLIFMLLAVLLGPHTLSAVNLIPMSILGVLLLFAGSQLGLTIIDLQGRKEYFVVLVILGITLAGNLAAGFIVGTAVAHILSMERFQV
ncbi:MAG: sulfate permease [bacterium]|nr:sulfate permease [bacterium]